MNNLTIGHLYETATSITIWAPTISKWSTLSEKEILLLIKIDPPKNGYTRLTFLHGANIIINFLYMNTKTNFFNKLS